MIQIQYSIFKRGRRTEDGGRRTGDRGQETEKQENRKPRKTGREGEARYPRTEDGGQRTSPSSEVGMQGAEDGGGRNQYPISNVQCPVSKWGRRTGDRRQETGDREAGKQEIQESRKRKRSEDRGRRTEDRGRRTEDGGQRTVDGGRRGNQYSMFNIQCSMFKWEKWDGDRAQRAQLQGGGRGTAVTGHQQPSRRSGTGASGSRQEEGIRERRRGGKGDYWNPGRAGRSRVAKRSSRVSARRMGTTEPSERRSSSAERVLPL